MTEDKQRKKRKDPRIESEYFEEIEITNPITGKKETHKAKITRYKAVGEKLIGNKGVSDELDEFEYTLDNDEDESDEDENGDN